MGFLRLYLAICVLQNHFGKVFPWDSPTGSQAVQFFFIISGFYMSLVSNGKYKTLSDFYESRFIRIFAPYYITIVIFSISSLFSGLIFNNWGIFQNYTKQLIHSIGVGTFIISVIPNFTILGSDLLMFFEASDQNKLSFSNNFAHHPSPLYLGLLLPQCWSVSLELMFYLLVPFLCSLSNFKLILLVVISLFSRIAFYEITGLKNDPWSYRFIGFEFLFFGIGILLHRFTMFSFRNLNISAPNFLLPFVYALVILIGYFSFKTYFNIYSFFGSCYSDIISILAFAPLIGVIFEATKNCSFDRQIGELSYSVYLNHLYLGSLLKTSLPVFWLPFVAPITALVSILVAVIFQMCFFSSIDKWRMNKFTKLT